MTEREKSQLPLLEHFRLYFNERRGAQIEIIGDRHGEVIVRYFNGDEVRIPDPLTWTSIFNKLSEMHPKKITPVKGRDPS